MNPEQRFRDAIDFAVAHEIGWPRDPLGEPLRWGVHHEDPPPYNRLRGPVHARGGVSGVVLQHGREVAAWGEPERADLTFSVAKTYLGAAGRRGPAARGCCPMSTSRSSRDCPASASIRRTTAPSLGAICSNRPASGRAAASAFPTRWTAIATWRTTRARPAAARATRGRCRRRAATGNTTTCASTSCRWRCCTCSAAPLPEVFREALMRPLECGADLALARLRRCLGRRPASAPGAVGARRHALGRAASRSARATRRASASCCSTAAATPAAS